MIWRFAFIALSLLAFPAWAEKIEYKIYSIDDSGNQTRLAQGIKEYGDSDFEIKKKEGRGETHWAKSLELYEGFAVGASIYQEPEIKGFGMWAQRSPCGFSWEWFNLSGPDSYIKLQESGEVSVVYRSAAGAKEISAIKFDTDVSLRLNESRKGDR
jgi:hypothetical protein